MMLISQPIQTKMLLNSPSDDPKRIAILDAATRLFLTHGFRSVSMDKIAGAAPVSKATLYNHFASKNALFAAVVSRLCTNLLDTVMQATEEENDDVEDTLEKIATSFVDLLFTEEGLGIYRLIVAESNDFPELGQLVYDASAKIVLTQLEQYLQRLNASGCFHIADPEFAADAFFSLLKSDLHCQCLMATRSLPSQQEKQRLVQRAMNFYKRGVLYAH
jgi:TetR/AcrR family transcriptional repressor of mexJK operon